MTPTPYHGIPGYYLWIYCVPSMECSSGYANYLYYVLQPGGLADSLLTIWVCASPNACTPATPPPPPPPQTWPCDKPPEITGGIIIQPCDYWPGWGIQARVVIPPAQARVNPWPGPSTDCGRYSSPPRRSGYSSSLTAPFPASGIDYNTEYPSSTFTCSNGTQVTEGARVNWRIGVAWQRWTRGSGNIFRRAPADEFTWIIPDRYWNGGEKVYTSGPNQTLEYTFETSSWGMPEVGPRWSPECQERDCSCERACAIVCWNARIPGQTTDMVVAGVDAEF